MRVTNIALGALLLAACTTHPRVTYLDVQVLFDSQLSLDQLVFDVASDQSSLLDPTPRPGKAGAPLTSGGHVAILLPDSAAGISVTTRVRGRKQGQDMMSGQAVATPLLGQAVAVTVILGKRSDLSSIAITPDDPLAVGAMQQLKATGTFVDGTTLDLTSSASWSSSDANILLLDASGVATGMAEGLAAVSATVLGVTGQVNLAVSSAELNSLSITPVAPSIPVGLTRAFHATGAFADGSARDLTDQVVWSVTDPNIAAFDGTTHGLLHARQPGMVSIGAKLGAVSTADMVTVSDATLTSIVVSPTNPKLARGALRQLFATGLFSDGTSADLTESADWSSSDVTIADVGTIDGSRGQVDALAEGTVTITAGEGDVTGTTSVTVTAATLKSVAIQPTNLTLAKGTSAPLTITGVFSDSSMMDLTGTAMWSSDAPDVITIGNGAANKGRATALGAGSAHVHAVVGGMTADTLVTGTSAVLTALAVTPTNPVLPKGGKLQLTATGSFTDSSVQDLTSQVIWSAGDGSALNVSNVQGTRGLAFAVAPGSVLATATYGGMTGSTSVTVTAATLTSLTITPSNLSIASGTIAQLHASGVYSDQTMQDLTAQVTWTSSAMGVVVVSNAPGTQGLATSVMPGASTVTVMLGSTTTSTGLTVTPAQLAAIGVTPTNPSVPNGATQQFHAVGIYTDQTTQDLTGAVTWGSSDPLTVSISNAAGSRGVALAAASSGSVGISATLGAIAGSTSMTVTPAVLTTLEVTPTNPSAPVGTTVQFQATGVYSDKTRRDLTGSVTWSSSDATVAAVSNVAGSQGMATALKIGSTSIVSATVTGVSGSTTLTVTDAVLQSLAVQPTNPSIALGTLIQFSAVGSYSDGSHRDLTSSVTWTSSAPQVAAISNTDGSRGLATSLAVGSTTIITAVAGGKMASTTLTVTPAVLSGLQVTPVQAAIPLGTTQQLAAIGTYTDNSTQVLTAQVTWSSTDATVATVSNAADSAGLVTSVAAGGPVAITASLGGQSASASLTVTAAGLRSISVTPANSSIALGTTLQLSAIGIYTDNSTLDLTSQVTWSSDATGVALVSNGGGEEGKVTSVAVGGPANISASLGGKSGSTGITVTAATLKSIAVTPAQVTIPLGTKQPMVATGIYTDGSTQDLTGAVTWSSSNEGVATVSNSGGSEGLVASVAVGGPITIGASFGGQSGSTTLSISAATLVSILITPRHPHVPIGTTLAMTATGTYTDGSTLDLTAQASWSSANSAVVSVSNAAGEQGVITPLMAGSAAAITAQLGGKSNSTTVTASAALLVDLTISPPSPSVALGITQQFSVVGTYTDNSSVDLTAQATWTSSDDAVATISNAGGSEGLATPNQANASATIRADYGGLSASTLLSVTAATLTSISIAPPDPTVPKGLTLQLTATGHYSDSSTLDLTTMVAWESGDEGVVTVSSAGGSEGLASAQASAPVMAMTTVTATLGGVMGSTLLTVSQAQLQSISLSPGAVSIANGTTAQLTATGHFSDGSTQDLTTQVNWQSDSEAVGTVSNADGSQGLVVSVSPGDATISASLGAQSGSAGLHVKDVQLLSIAVAPGNPTIDPGGNVQLTATGTFDDQSTQDLTQLATWSSDDETVAVVFNAAGMQGLCSAVSGGTANLTAAALGQAGTTTVTVNSD